jgi:hypothetical protein
MASRSKDWRRLRSEMMWSSDGCVCRTVVSWPWSGGSGTTSVPELSVEVGLGNLFFQGMLMCDEERVGGCEGEGMEGMGAREVL